MPTDTSATDERPVDNAVDGHAGGAPDTPFTPDVIAAVTRHMNTDHPQDSLLICRAAGQPTATAAVMTGMDAEGADFEATVEGGTVALRLPWRERLTERAQVRLEVVHMYREACAALGLTPRPPAEH